MEMMGKIRRMYFRDKFSLHEITRRTGLQRISELYAIESRGRELANAERHALREREALPKLQAMQEWLQRTRDTVAWPAPSTIA